METRDLGLEEPPPLGPLERLTEEHELIGFAGGSDDVGDQAGWLRSQALANDREGYTRAFVACFPGTKRVGAFFGLSSAVVARSDLPKRAQPHGTPRVVPAALIGRLALHADLQGRRLGLEILIAAIEQCVVASEQIAFRLIIVDAASPKARRLYEKVDFRPIANLELPNRLFLPVKTATAMIKPQTEKQ
jgi:GNAT superfamily N-acetyltransferase